MARMRSPLTYLRDRRRAAVSKRLRQRHQPLRVMRWLPTTTTVLLVVIGGGLVALWLANTWADEQTAGVSPADATAVAEAARLRLDAIKTALTVAAGLGAGVTLLVALRKQSVSERAQRFTEEDSQEQHITALYVAAVEQLGSEKAAVRLGGLYALERLGNDNPKLRQTVVDVICAYLRMPFNPPAEVLRANAEKSPEYLGRDAAVPNPDQQSERRQELQVRLTAQRLLAEHLRSTSDTEEPSSYWRDHEDQRISLDLSGATLVRFALAGCQPAQATLTDAQLHGNADLTGAKFHGKTDLTGAQFHGVADLSRADFQTSAYLTGAQFHGVADLSGANFYGVVDMVDAQFHGGADLVDVQFHERAFLSRAQFGAGAFLSRARFRSAAFLGGAEFQGVADLRGAQFDRGVDMENVRVKSGDRLPAGWTAVPEPRDGLYDVMSTNKQS